MLKISVLLLGLVCFSQAFGGKSIESDNVISNVSTFNSRVISGQQKSTIDDNLVHLSPHLSMSKKLSHLGIISKQTEDISTPYKRPLYDITNINQEQSPLNTVNDLKEIDDGNETYNTASHSYEDEKRNYLLAATLISITATLIIAALFYIRFTSIVEFQIARILRMVATLIRSVNLNRLKKIWS